MGRESGADPWIEEFEAQLVRARAWRKRGQVPVHDPQISVFQKARILTRKADHDAHERDRLATDEEKRHGRLL